MNINAKTTNVARIIELLNGPDYYSGPFSVVEKVSTLADFKAVLAGLDLIERAYDLFEELTSESVRDEVYALSANSGSPEPFRAAMEILGYPNY